MDCMALKCYINNGRCYIISISGHLHYQNLWVAIYSHPLLIIVEIIINLSFAFKVFFA
jgi:hypothetical protein